MMDSSVCKQHHTSQATNILEIVGFDVIAVTVARRRVAPKLSAQLAVRTELRCAEATA